MNSSNITSSLLMQATRIQTLSTVRIKRQMVSSPTEDAMYGKRFASSTVHDSSSDKDDSVMDQDTSLCNQMESSDSEAKKMRTEPHSLSDLGFPPEPTNCCMSGCANCVWIQYAEELKKRFCSTSGVEAREIILNKISDPSMKMFLSIEFDNLDDECKWRPRKNDSEDKC